MRKKSKGGARRAGTKNPGLHKELHPKSRWEYMDGDYYNSLSNKDQEYMSKFLEEYYGASLSPASDKTTWGNDFHSTKELRKDCTDRNNARNRDMYTILRTRGMVEEMKMCTGDEGNKQNEGSEFAIDQTIKIETLTADGQENVLNELIDLNDAQKKTEVAFEEVRFRQDQQEPRLKLPKEPQ